MTEHSQHLPIKKFCCLDIGGTEIAGESCPKKEILEISFFKNISWAKFNFSVASQPIHSLQLS